MQLVFCRRTSSRIMPLQFRLSLPGVCFVLRWLSSELEHVCLPPLLSSLPFPTSFPNFLLFLFTFYLASMITLFPGVVLSLLTLIKSVLMQRNYLGMVKCELDSLCPVLSFQMHRHLANPGNKSQLCPRHVGRETSCNTVEMLTRLDANRVPCDN